MAFKRRLKSAKDFCDAIKNNEDYIVSDGVYWRDKKGTIIDGIETR